MWKRVAIVTLVALAGAAAASAQTPASGAGSQQPARPDATTGAGDTRPATTTINGDTGLWYVSTGEILPAKRWSFSLYRVNTDFNQGFTDVSNWPVTFGYGLKDRAEIFGAWTLVRRIDRDVRPIFVAGQPEAGGLVNEYPFVRQGWSDNQLGDLWIGGKYNIMSEHRQQRAAVAVRAMVKLPTAKDDEEGVGTGKPDFAFDGIFSKEINQRVEFAGNLGFVFRGDPDAVDLSNGFTWGFGVGVPSRKHLRLTAELHGEAYFSDTLTLNTAVNPLLVGDDLSTPPLTTTLNSPVNASIGLTWQGAKGVFAGAGLNWAIQTDGREKFGSNFGDVGGDSLGFEFRVGYHPGVRVYVAPPPPPPPPPPPTPVVAAARHDLTVKAECNPCTVDVGKTSTVSATALDSIGCSVTYGWSAPSGSLTDRASRQTPWTAPMQEGTVPVTVTVTCPSDGKNASDTVNIQVVRPKVVDFVFEDVHFDFDRYSLRPEATRALDEAIRTLQANPELRIQIEGHTCNIGTAEYNLALGERRAGAVREYLTGRGISASRLETISYGEERPKYDNSREETRRLNRRAALVVRITR